METIFLIIIVIVGLAATLKLIEYVILGISTSRQKKAQGKLDVPVTYQTAWWAHQDKMLLDDFDVEIVKSDLNLMNSQSIVLYTIKGTLRCNNSEVLIEEIHISERVNKDEAEVYDRIFELTPVVTCKAQKGASTGVVSFEVKNQHQVKSTHWGTNRILFVCGNMQKMIELEQLK